jgi:hypothetical protein
MERSNQLITLKLYMNAGGISLDKWEDVCWAESSMRKVCRSSIMGKAFLAIRFNNKIING